jgi:uncharacterized protein (TIGR02145 family)
MSRILVSLLSILFFLSCQKDIKTYESAQINESVTRSEPLINGKSTKITICHKTNSPNNPWTSITVSSNALPDHLSHGDIVPDADGDGYTKSNPCASGSQNDCNDNDPGINPASTEICANNIDDNCDGQVNENCTSVTICNKTWMLYNLDVAKYRNGDDIPQAMTNEEWINAGNNQTGAWCYYANNSANGPVYGRLYNWYAVNDARGLAPAGWHIATDAEWTALYDCVGGALIAGGKLKATGTTHWESPNAGATNMYGFTALPGGLRNLDGVFFYVGKFGVWWSATESNAAFAWSRGMYNISEDAGWSPRPKKLGFALRCVRD